jgi:hypothetical protein
VFADDKFSFMFEEDGLREESGGGSMRGICSSRVELAGRLEYLFVG